MSATMRAAVLHDIKDLRVEDFPKPTNLGPDDVLVHVKYNGLCGTDASEYAKNSMLVPLKIANCCRSRIKCTRDDW
jgi:threonine dehydrogenase-like Zn-dependent dehydrogenase